MRQGTNVTHSPHHPAAITKAGGDSSPKPMLSSFFQTCMAWVNATPIYSESWGSAPRCCTSPTPHRLWSDPGIPSPVCLSSPLSLPRRLKTEPSRPWHSLSNPHACRFPAAGPNVTFHKCHPHFQPPCYPPHPGSNSPTDVGTQTSGACCRPLPTQGHLEWRSALAPAPAAFLASP